MPIATCEWFTARIESFLTDQMSEEDKALARSHVDACASCRRDLSGFDEVDRRVRTYFRNEVLRASRPPAMSWRRPAWALALAGSLVLGWTLAGVRQPQTEPIAAPVASNVSPSTAIEAEAPTAPPRDPKTENTRELDRAKPATSGVAPVPPVELTGRRTMPPGGPFLIADQAGFSRDLKSYAGYVLVFARLDPSEPLPVERFEQVYSEFGGNPKLRIVGVFDSGTRRPSGATFPMGFNQGSKLLDAPQGQMVVVDSAGDVRLRTPLLQDSGNLVKSLSSLLEQLGAR